MAARPDSNGLLKSINIPSLLIFGEEDAVTDLGAAENLKNRIKGSRLSVIRGAGHYSNLENPQEFEHALKLFLR